MKKTFFRHILLSFVLEIPINIPLGIISTILVISKFNPHQSGADLGFIGVFIIGPILAFPISLIIASIISYKYLFKKETLTVLQKVCVIFAPELVAVAFVLLRMLFTNLYFEAGNVGVRINEAIEQKAASNYPGKISINNCYDSLSSVSDGNFGGMNFFIECRIDSQIEDNFLLDVNVYEAVRFPNRLPEKINLTPEQDNKNSVVETALDGKSITISRVNPFSLSKGTHVLRFKIKSIPGNDGYLILDNKLLYMDHKGELIQVTSFIYETNAYHFTGPPYEKLDKKDFEIL